MWALYTLSVPTTSPNAEPLEVLYTFGVTADSPTDTYSAGTIGRPCQTVHGEMTRLRLIPTAGPFSTLVQNPDLGTDPGRRRVY